MTAYSAPGIQIPGVSFESIFHAVCEETGINRSQMMSRSRKMMIVWARKIFCHLSREYIARASTSDIGGEIQRDHSTAIHSIQSSQNLIEVDKEYKELYVRCKERLISEAR